MAFIDGQLRAKERLRKLDDQRDLAILVHYSCENLRDDQAGRSPRVTSIACRRFASGETQSFSINMVAELPQFADRDPTNNFDELEKHLLEGFFDFVGRNVQHAVWIHWNMRDVRYGFPAIEHRFRALGGTPVPIPDERKCDLARLLVSRYGRRYVGHPRLEKIIDLNKITKIDFLSGEEEVKAFQNGQYFKMHSSTLRKVDALGSLLEASIDGSLKTHAPLWDRHGGRIRFVWEKVIWKPVTGWLTGIMTIIAAIDYVFFGKLANWFGN